MRPSPREIATRLRWSLILAARLLHLMPNVFGIFLPRRQPMLLDRPGQASAVSLSGPMDAAIVRLSFPEHSRCGHRSQTNTIALIRRLAAQAFTAEFVAFFPAEVGEKMANRPIGLTVTCRSCTTFGSVVRGCASYR